MKLLAIETATEACSCALRLEGETLSQHEVAPRRHGELILGMINRLLSDAGMSLGELDCIAYGRGPGAFTGLRIAAAVAQGLAFGAELPIVGVSSLHVLAEGVRRMLGRKYVLAAFDARMDEVYWGCYAGGAEDDALAVAAGDRLSPPEAIQLPAGQSWFGAGSGWTRYRDTLADLVDVPLDGADGVLYPDAVDLAALGEQAFSAGQRLAPDEAVPVYLRDQVARASVKSRLSVPPAPGSTGNKKRHVNKKPV